MESIISNSKYCHLCGKWYSLQKHHCLGGPDRQKADDDGLWVWLCADCHIAGKHAVHGPYGTQYRQMLRREAQAAYERTHTREEWMERYGRNYLDG